MDKKEIRRLRKLELYSSRKVEGLCVDCGEKAVCGLKCQNCKKRQDTNSKQHYENRKNKGLCHRCGEESCKGKVYCDKCSDEIKDEKANRRKENIASGLCAYCGSLCDSLGIMCCKCLTKRKEKHLQLKKIVVEHYGGFCKCCRDNFLARLTIDHIDGGGNKQRKLLNTKGGSGFYQWLKKNNFPVGFQVLCASCNLCKHTLGYCPHGEEYVNINAG